MGIGKVVVLMYCTMSFCRRLVQRHGLACALPRPDRPILEIYKYLTDIWVQELVDRTLQFCFGNNKAAQVYFWEYINGKQTFILDLTGDGGLGYLGLSGNGEIVSQAAVQGFYSKDLTICFAHKKTSINTFCKWQKLTVFYILKKY